VPQPNAIAAFVLTFATAPFAPTSLAAAAPPATTAPSHRLSGTLALARAAARDGDHAVAAIRFHQVVIGPAHSDVPAAQLGLVAALFRLELYSVARSMALTLATAGHPKRADVLPWLVALAEVLDPDPDLLDALSTYSDVELAAPQFDAVRGDLYAMIGRARYHRGELEGAIVAFSRVPKDAEDYVAAQYLAGVAHTRLGTGAEAVAAFKNVLRFNAHAVGRRSPRESARMERYSARRSQLLSHRPIQVRSGRPGRQRSPKRKTAALRRLSRRMGRRRVTTTVLDRYEEHRRADEMSRLSMAYVFFQAGQFDLASKYFTAVPQTSPYWLDAVFGDAWSEFLAAYTDADRANEHYQRVLGHVHTMHAPFFRYDLYPELPLLEAVTYYYNCRYRSAARALDGFDAQYLVIRDTLSEFLSQQREDFELADLFTALRTGAAHDVAPETLRIIEGLLDDRALRRQHDRIARIDAEVDAADALQQPGGEALLESVHETIALAASRAREDSGAAVRSRLAHAVANISRFEQQSLRIRYELEPKLATQAGAPGDAKRPHPDVEHDLYGWNGEYWQDELGEYRVKITSRCE